MHVLTHLSSSARYLQSSTELAEKFRIALATLRRTVSKRFMQSWMVSQYNTSTPSHCIL